MVGTQMFYYAHVQKLFPTKKEKKGVVSGLWYSLL